MTDQTALLLTSVAAFVAGIFLFFASPLFSIQGLTGWFAFVLGACGLFRSS